MPDDFAHLWPLFTAFACILAYWATLFVLVAFLKQRGVVLRNLFDPSGTIRIVRMIFGPENFALGDWRISLLTVLARILFLAIISLLILFWIIPY